MQIAAERAGSQLSVCFKNDWRF